MTVSSSSPRCSDQYLKERLARLEDRIAAEKELSAQRFRAAEETLTAAKETLNGMREIVVAAQRAFMPRDEYGARHQDLANQLGGLSEKIAALTVDVNSMRSGLESSKKGVGEAWHNIAILATLVISLASVAATLMHIRAG